MRLSKKPMRWSISPLMKINSKKTFIIRYNFQKHFALIYLSPHVTIAFIYLRLNLPPSTYYLSYYHILHFTSLHICNFSSKCLNSSTISLLSHVRIVAILLQASIYSGLRSKRKSLDMPEVSLFQPVHPLLLKPVEGRVDPLVLSLQLLRYLVPPRLLHLMVGHHFEPLIIVLCLALHGSAVLSESLSKERIDAGSGYAGRESAVNVRSSRHL